LTDDNATAVRVNDDVIAVYRDALYLGSHPALTGQKRPDPADLVVTTEGVLFTRGRKELGGIPWSAVNSIYADDREGVERRITATRVILLGALAFIARKETRIAYLVISDDDGDWIFGVPGMSGIELEASLTHLQQFLPRRTLPPPTTATSAGTSISPSDRLRRLQDLHDTGLISDDEFSQKRAAILDEL
jgi:hypothetical protein